MENTQNLPIANQYHSSKVYKLSVKTLNYIGSTTKDLNNRLSIHKSLYKKYKKDGNCNYCYSYILFDAFGLDDVKIELLEEVKCENRKELEQIERKHILANNCVNKNIPRTRKQYYQDLRADLLKKQNEYNRSPERKMILSAKFKCVCGGSFSYSNRLVHSRTNKHLKYEK